MWPRTGKYNTPVSPPACLLNSASMQPFSAQLGPVRQDCRGWWNWPNLLGQSSSVPGPPFSLTKWGQCLCLTPRVAVKHRWSTAKTSQLPPPPPKWGAGERSVNEKLYRCPKPVNPFFLKSKVTRKPLDTFLLEEIKVASFKLWNSLLMYS